ncbi:DUF6668 family protein [Streptomyces sp. NPDC000349]|uniref:DUF6668 family protein n=1 Tax=Streptomyces sp. NPDC000349 TaxID=3154249 RepID=UPI003369BD9B
MWIRGPAVRQDVTATAVPPRPAARITRPDGAEPAQHAPSPHRGQPVAWVNAHGGGGASTLARVLGGADLRLRWPEPARGEPGGVLLVARTHAGGMQAAAQALNTLRTGEHPAGVHLIALVLVADAPGRLPRPLGRRVRVLRSAAEVHRVPWIPEWRLGEEVDPLPNALRALAELASSPSFGRTAGPR